MLGPSSGRLACLGEDTLAAVAEGLVDGVALPAIEEHLADCAHCRAVLTRAAGDTAVGVETTASPSNDPEPDAVLAGAQVSRYLVEGLIGRGGMGAVYSAIDPDLNRKVAVKLLRAGAWSDAARQQIRARLLREAQAMARLSHPEVITVYDVGTFGERLFVAMEYVEGETLRQWRAARYRTYQEILSVYERAGSGLAAAHEAGLVHRDFKPDNVLVGRDGRVRVSDFGLARAVDGADLLVDPNRGAVDARQVALTSTLTRTGTLLGTPAYMAPEQLAGGAADARSDVFGFCVALYEALYGERPFPGSTVPALKAAIESGAVRAAPVMTRVPGWVRRVLLQGLHAAPDERFASMRDLLDALRAANLANRRRIGRAVAMAVGMLGILAAAVAFARQPASAARGDLAGPHPAPAPNSVATSLGAAAEASPLGTARDRVGPEMLRAANDLPSRAPSAARPAPPIDRLRKGPATTTAAPAPLPSHPRLIGHNGALILE